MDNKISVDSQNSEESNQKPSKLGFYQKPGLVFCYINVATLMQFIHMQFVSSSMRGLEMDLGYSPKRLASFIVAEQVSYLAFIPIWGLLSDLYEIKFVLMVSIASSGVLVMVLGVIREFFSMIIIRVLNGMMIGSSIPVGQKYVVLANMKHVGYAFGVIHAVCNLGRLISAVAVTRFASNRYGGIFGWRICYFVLGIGCILVTFPLVLIPRLKSRNCKKCLYDNFDKSETKNVFMFVKVIWKKFVGIIRVKTVIIIILLNFFGQGPFTSASFVTIYLQYCRLSDLKSGITTGFIIVGSAIGGVLCGVIADRIHKRFPKYGRLWMGVIASISRAIILVLVLFGITFDNIFKRYYLVAIGLFFIGTTMASISFVDRSIFVDVIMPSEQSFGLACALFLCGATSGLVFPSVMGYLLEDVFGYKESQLAIEEMPINVLKKNAFALRESISCLCIFSSISSTIFYLILFLTYQKDAEAIKERVEKELKETKKN